MKNRFTKNIIFAAAAAFVCAPVLAQDADSMNSEPCYGAEVLNYEQGPQTNGQPVAADRSNPEITLGAPSLNNSAGNFFSLGVGGFIEIGFGGIVLDLPGNDIKVVETSFSGNNCGLNDDEFADIELSSDGINWEFYGTICRNEEIDIADVGLDYITAIRITNSEITTTLDGYDVDGVIALNGCEDFDFFDSEECYGHEVLLYEPGTGNIPADRMNPEQALGAPERDNTINFVSLGFGGTLILGFEDAAIAVEGADDLEVVETTFGNQTCQSYEERADVYVSQQVVLDASEIDDSQFVYVGESCTNGEFFDVYAETGFEYFTLVKIVDVTPEAAQFSNRDGYDVDGIVALHGCAPVPDLGEEPAPVCEGPWRTQTQGGWGSPAAGNNPGAYRNANFDAAFPDGLVLGCEEGNTLTLTSAAAVQAFLPSGGQPSSLSNSLTDPTGNQGTLAGNLTALALSLGFDANDSEFSASQTLLADLTVQSGTFEGFTVGELFDLANEVFGGCSQAYSAQQINSILDDINNAYTDGDDQGTGIIDCASSEQVETPDPFCTNETVVQQHNVTDGNVRLTSMGYHLECDGLFGYRWRIRNESGEPREVFYNFAGAPELQGPFNLEGDEEVHFTTGFGQSAQGGGTMRIFVDGDQVDVKAHGGSTKDLADCGEGCPETPVPVSGQLTPGISLETYPNPSPGAVNVEFVSERGQRITVEVTDLSGRTVSTLFNAEVNADQMYRTEFNGAGLPNGIYITRMTTEDEIVVKKVMIAR